MHSFGDSVLNCRITDEINERNLIKKFALFTIQ